MLNKKNILICLLLGAITMGIYWPATSYKFIDFDDEIYVFDNPAVQQGLTRGSIAWAFKNNCTGNWHPLTWISHMLDCQLYGAKSGGHHFTNILFHTLNAMLVFLVLLRMTGATWPSCVVAALFAWHPAHVESVAWVSERKDVLSTFFGLLTMLAYAIYACQPETKKRKAWLIYSLSMVCYALSLLSKSMLVTLPFVLLLLDFWPLGRLRLFGTSAIANPEAQTNVQPPKTLVLEKLPYLAMALGCCVITYWMQQSVGAAQVNEVISPVVRIEHALHSYVRYLGLLFWPSKLAIFYPYQMPGTTDLFISTLFLAAVSIAAMRSLSGAPYFAVGWFWFLGTLVPVIGLIQVGMQDVTDRYTYFPSIGIFILMVWGAMAALAKIPILVVKAGAAAALAACLVLTSVQLRYWRDSFTLFGHALKVTKGNFIALTVLGDALQQEGKYDEAITNLEASLTFSTNYPTTYFMLGKIYMKKGMLDKAVANLSTAECYRDPNQLAIEDCLGQAYYRQRKYDEAYEHFMRETLLQPGDPLPECEMALICEATNDVGSAIEHYQAALRSNPKYVEALNNLAWIRAANAKPEFRNGAEAVELARRACEVTGNRVPSLMGTLAAAYAEAGDFKDAIAAGTKAHDLAIATNQKKIADRNQELIGLYRAGRAYHEGNGQ